VFIYHYTIDEVVGTL